MAEITETNYLGAKGLKKYAALKKRHLKLILDDEVMLDQRKSWRCPQQWRGRYKIDQLKKEPPSSQDEPLAITLQESCFKWITFIK